MIVYSLGCKRLRDEGKKSFPGKRDLFYQGLHRPALCRRMEALKEERYGLPFQELATLHFS